MSVEQDITCRTCGEIIRLEERKCPHCGTAIRSRKGPLAMILVGAILLLGSAAEIGRLWVFAIIGVLLILGGGYFLWDRRKRRQLA